jgi:DNA-binding CsgD family transcriptional regulator/tetratricopeptide (TPR) repeat protein
MGAALIGRDAELSTLVSTLDTARAGGGAIVLLTGDAGIGKSALTAELRGIAAEQGVTCLEGRAHPLHAGLAYAPIVEAIRPHLDAALLDGLTDLGRLLADPRLPDAPPLGDSALERTRMFEAVGHLFARFAERSPVLLVVEDLHWADRGTVELVHYLGRTAEQHRILVLATARTGAEDGPLHDLTVTVRRDHPDRALDLAPLSDAAVTELARSLLGDDPPADLLASVTSRARGVPLFVTALVQGPTDLTLIPAIVRDVVLDRLNRLDGPDRRLLEIVAVAGEAGATQTLRGVFGGDDFDPTLRALVAGGLVTEQISGGSETYRVTHPLYAEVAYAELTAGERRALHAGFATAIDPDDVLAVAPHYLRAGNLVDAGRASEVLAAAGWRALSVHAADEAARYLGAALEGGQASDRTTVELLEGLGRAQVASGELDAALTAFHRALDLADQLRDVDSVSSLTHWLALLESERGDHSRPLAPPPRDAVTTDAEHLLLRTVFLLRHGDEAQLRAAARGLAAFAEVGDAAPAQAAAYLGHELEAMLDNDFAAARASAEQALRYGEQCAEVAPMLGTWANRDLIGLTVLAGDIPGAVALTRQFFDTFGRAVAPPTRCNARYTLALTLYLAGDLDTALDEIEAGIALATRVALPRALGRTLGCRAFLLAETGRTADAVACLANARASHTADEVSLIAVDQLVATALALSSGRAQDAPPLTDRALYEEPVVMSLRIHAAGIAAIAAGNPFGALEIAAYLHDIGRTAPFLAVLGDQLDGLRTGDADLLHSVADRLSGMGAVLHSAKARLQWAEIGEDPDDEEARQAVVDCLAVFDRSGAVSWVDRTRRLARILGVRLPATRKNGALSKREAQIVGLVGDGLSNADIAAQLYLSERTVETHLRNSYARLGLRSRVALARWAAEHPPV